MIVKGVNDNQLDIDTYDILVMHLVLLIVSDQLQKSSMINLES